MRVSSVLCSALAVSVVSVVFSCAPGYAARITAPGLHVTAAGLDSKEDANWPADPVKCDLILDGDIAENDAAALKQSFETIKGNQNAFTFFLCLRSGGGNVAEALKIARFVMATQRPSIATV